MLIRIRHTLQYTYERAVFLEPMTVRLTPRQDACQRLVDHAQRILPKPHGVSWALEPSGTDARIAWFEGEHAVMRIDSESTVRTLRDNPFDAFITHPASLSIPTSYPEAHADALRPYRFPSGVAESSGTSELAVAQWSESIAREADGKTLAFLLRLNETIYRDFRIIERAEGDPFSPAQTLAGRCGACRDVAELFIAACRVHGIAARFVSGYSIHNPPESTHDELHAWAEVHLPGAGWRGYDPSLGLSVADGHVALAAAPDHRLAAAVTGTYRGSGVGSTLSYDVSVTAVESEE